MPGHSNHQPDRPVSQATCLRNGSFFVGAAIFVLFLAAGLPAGAQFKEVGPPPVSAPVARQQIRMLLENVDSTNSRQTIDKISALLIWYRDLADEELIAAWKSEGRVKLIPVLESLSDASVASGVVEFSWRQQREATFVPASTSTMVMLMSRYSASAKPFQNDLAVPARSGGRMPDLTPTEAAAVCRILVDMPDVGTWRKDALVILPHYRRAAESVLAEDLHGGDPEKSARAQFWLSDLRWGSQQDTVSQAPVNQGPGLRRRPVAVSQGSDRLPPSIDSPTPPSVRSDPPETSVPQPRPIPAPPVPRPIPPPPPPVPLPASQAQSGTLQCVGAPVPQNAEYVFRNVPLGKLQLDYDTKIWDARVAPGDGQTQRVILRNKGTGPQKRCIVHWSVVP